MRQIFQSLPWIHAAEPDFLVKLYEELGVVRHVKKGKMLKGGGQSPRLFYLKKGLCAYLIAEQAKGRPSVLSLIVPGRTMGDLTCLTGDKVNVFSVAWQNSEILEVDVAQLYSRIEATPGLMRRLALHMVRKEESHLEGMVANFTLSADKRIKVFLRVLLESYGLEIKPHDNIIPLLLTNEQIGLVTNLTRVSVSRIFSQWHEAGLLHKKGKTLIVEKALFDDIYDWITR